MTVIDRSALVGHTAREMYSLVADVESYQQFLYENLFKPAGMTSTMFQTGSFAVPGADKKVVAHLYAGQEDNGTPRGRENLPNAHSSMAKWI